MCYRNGTGHRCECCDFDKVELRIIPHDHNEDHEENVSGMDRLNDEKKNDPLNNRKALEPVLMIVAMPGDPILIITDIEVKKYFPFFEANDSISDVPGLDLVMSYDKDWIFQIGDRYYLDGPCLIYHLDEDGETVSLSGEMMYSVREWIEKRTVTVRRGEAEMQVLDLN